MTKDQFNQTTRIQRAVKMHTVPAEKWPQMIQRTIIGTLFVGLGLASGFLLDWGKWPSIGLTVLGATIWSTQVVKNALMALLTPFQAWKRAVGKDVDPDAA